MMMKKTLLFLGVFFLSITCVIAQGTEGLEKQEKEQVKLVYHTILSPNDPHVKGVKLFAEEVEKISNGNIVVDVYDGGQLYNQSSQTTALKQGKIDMSDMGMDQFDEAQYCGMFKSAYIFTSFDHAKRFYESQRGQELFDDLAQKLGVRILGVNYYGNRHVHLTGIKKDVTTPQDMKGIKLRMPGGPEWTALGEALGASPTPIDFNEVYMALKTGTIDGQDNGLVVSKAMGFYEVADKVIMTGHLVHNLHFAINEKKWQSLTDQQQGWIKEAVETASQYITDEFIKQETELVNFYHEQNIEIIEPDKDAFVEYARNYYQTNDSVTKYWDWDLYDTVASYAD